jgi:hypothetical protein
LFCIGLSAFAFDPSLNGSWGLIKDNDKQEFIKFNTNEINIMGYKFSQTDYEETDDAFYIDDAEGESIIIQYFRLAPNKLLFIIWNPNNIAESVTLILTRF